MRSGRRNDSNGKPDTERYLLQIDRQTKRSFKTSEAAQTVALEIKARFPILSRFMTA
jgi:hypothetical protein